MPPGPVGPALHPRPLKRLKYSFSEDRRVRVAKQSLRDHGKAAIRTHPCGAETRALNRYSLSILLAGNPQTNGLDVNRFTLMDPPNNLTA
jgi:hypothetical protein